jgi:hypothetical protein
MNKALTSIVAAFAFSAVGAAPSPSNVSGTAQTDYARQLQDLASALSGATPTEVPGQTPISTSTPGQTVLNSESYVRRIEGKLNSVKHQDINGALQLYHEFQENARQYPDYAKADEWLKSVFENAKIKID